MSEKPFDLIEELRKMFREQLEKELDEAEARMLEELTPPPGWKGFTGIRGILDETEYVIVDRWRMPVTFTPAEFEKHWDSLPRGKRLQYIKDKVGG